MLSFKVKDIKSDLEVHVQVTSRAKTTLLSQGQVPCGMCMAWKDNQRHSEESLELRLLSHHLGRSSSCEPAHCSVISLSARTKQASWCPASKRERGLGKEAGGKQSSFRMATEEERKGS